MFEKYLKFDKKYIYIYRCIELKMQYYVKKYQIAIQ